jgi:hypothetical protein
MTNLEAKFEALELQLTTQQTAVINALNAILDALGAPPPTATVTLATVAAQLTTMNTNIVAIATANAGFYSALLDAVGAINTNTDTIINNSSLNAQRTIAALYATFCACDTTTPLLAPPLDVTPTPVIDDAKCRRIQFYLSLFSTWLFDVANYGSSGAAITGDALGALIAAAGVAAGMTVSGAEAGVIFGIPGAVVGAIAGLIVAAVYILGGTQLVNWANDFAGAPVQAALLAGLYAANNADEGQTAFQSAVGANFSAIPAGIINALWWSAWSNDLYSSTPVVDDSAFDGSICAPPVEPEGCTTLINASYSGEGQAFHNETFTGYDYYHVRATSTTGNFNTAVWINDVLQTNPYGDYEAYFVTALAFKVQAASYYPGSGDFFVEGCMGTYP